MQENEPAFGAADLTNCEREPIHIPGSIQPHGALLALDADLRIVQAGGITHRLLGMSPGSLLGRTIADWLSPDQLERFRTLIHSGSPLNRPIQAFFLSRPDGSRIGATLHVSGGVIVLELEPLPEDSADDSIAVVQRMVISIQAAENPIACCQAAADQVRAVTGFDRVVVYRFLADGAGVVEAEALREGMAPFLGLRFPASDIPQQARALYLRNWIRVIPDAHYQPSPILPALNPVTGKPLDMSQSALRSVSPIHLEYLANMGVRASMSLSLVLDGKLWGLIACHHETPLHVTHSLRVALELFTHMASYLLETKITAEELSERLKKSTLHDAMMTALAREEDLTKGLTVNQPNLLDYVPAGGVCVWMDGHIGRLGVVPAADQIRDLVAWLNTTSAGGVFQTDSLPHAYPPAVAYKDIGSGILAISVSRSPRDYVIWFRPEVVQTVKWAGDPVKNMTLEDGELRLSPRKSFATWEQQMRLRSEPWNNVDIRTAEALRASLHEVVLLRIDQLSREREQARIRQEALLAELDRRIRQWEMTAEELKAEGDRRAVVEAELSQVLRRTVIDQENERQRIARELHDSLGQYLTIMQLDLDEIARHASVPEKVRDGVSRLKVLASDVGHEVNRLAWEIRPTSLDDLGLQTAVQQFLEEWSDRSGIAIDLHLTLNSRRLLPNVETTLYRILQEAVTNVVKHSEATRAGVILEANDDEVLLIVEDDGRGFPWEEAAEPGAGGRLGLIGIRERLALIGGHLEVETGTGRGTTLIVHAPI